MWKMQQKPRYSKAAREQQRKERKEAFIKRFAEYLAGEGVAGKSIKLQLGDKAAMEWSELRGLTPLFGYPTVAEAIQTLTEFLE